MPLRVGTVFWINATLALLSSSLIAWQLQSYVEDTSVLNGFVSAQQQVFLTKAEVQLQRMTDFIDREVQRMRLSTNETRRLVTAIADDPAIRTSAGALQLLNASLFNLFAHRVSFPKEQYGFAVNTFYPPDTDNVTLVQSLQTYADPLFDGGLQPIHAYTDPSSGITSAYQINLAVPASTSAATLDTDRVCVLDLTAAQYTFDYYSNAQIGIGYASRFDTLPWQSSDGNPWYFPQQSSWMKIRGVHVVVQSYASTVYWQEQLTALLGSNDADYILIDASRTVIATSYGAEVGRRAGCIANSSGAALLDCISAPLSAHPLAFFRYLSDQILSRTATAAGFFAPIAASSAGSNASSPSRAYTASSTYLGQPIVFVRLLPTVLEGPAQERFELLWFQFNPPRPQALSGSAAAVPILISFMLLIAVGSTLGVGAMLQRTFLSPMSALTQRMMAVTELDTEAIAKSADEGPRLELQSNATEFTEMLNMRIAFSKMSASIQWFLLYLPGDVVKDIMAATAAAGPTAGDGVTRTAHASALGPGAAARTLEELDLTLIFADIRGFTSATAALRGQPDVFVHLLQTYFENCSNALTDEGCTIDKYMGDAIMGFWGAPLACPDKAERACMGAMRMASVVEALRPEFEVHGWDLAVRIGVHSGVAMVGSIGSRRRLNYTALGDTVNTASRLEGLCKYTHSTVLVSDAVVDELHNPNYAATAAFVLRRAGSFVLKGCDVATGAYVLCGLPQDLYDAVNTGMHAGSTPSVSAMSVKVDSASARSDRTGSAAMMSDSGRGNRARLGQRKQRSTLQGLARRFRVPQDILSRIDALSAVQELYDTGRAHPAHLAVCELLGNNALYAAEDHGLLNDDVRKLLVEASATRDDIVAVQLKCLAAVHAGDAFDPEIVLDDK